MMWPIKWTESVKRKTPPKADTDNSKEKNKKCRKFNPQWIKERQWLRYDDDTHLMFCVPCTNFVESKKNRTQYPNSFVKGCSNFKTSALADHETSRLHLDAGEFGIALAKPAETVAKTDT